MKYLHKLAALALVTLGFTACNDAEDPFRYADHVYPEKMELGYYTAQYNASSKYEYAAVLTLDAQGDTVLYTYRVGKQGRVDEGLVRTLVTTGDVNYDPAIGVLTATSAAADNYYEEDAALTIATMLDGTRFAYECKYGKTSETAMFVRNTTAMPGVEGHWTAANADGSKTLDFTFGDLKVAGSPAASLTVGDGKATAYSYVQDGANVTMTNEAGATITLSYNDKFQLWATVDGEQYLLSRCTSEPEPEQFLPLYEGELTISAQTLDGDGPLFGSIQKMQTTLYQSDKDPSRYVLAPYIDNADGALFTVNDDLIIEIDKQNTGLEVDGYGAVYITGINVAGYQNNFPNNESHYDPAKMTFYFDVFYHCGDVGQKLWLGLYEDTFKVTAEATSKKPYTMKKSFTPQASRPALNLNPSLNLLKK